MADDLKRINKAVEDLGLQHGIDIRKLEADSERLVDKRFFGTGSVNQDEVQEMLDKTMDELVLNQQYDEMPNVPTTKPERNASPNSDAGTGGDPQKPDKETKLTAAQSKSMLDGLDEIASLGADTTPMQTPSPKNENKAHRSVESPSTTQSPQPNKLGQARENMQNIVNDAQAQQAAYNEKKEQIREGQALNQKITNLRNKPQKTPEERAQLKELETKRAETANKIHQPSPSTDAAATSTAAKTSNAAPSPASVDAAASSNQKVDPPRKEEPLYPTIASPHAADPGAQNSEKPTDHTLQSQVNEPSLKPQNRTMFDADDIEKDADQLEIELRRNLEVRKQKGIADDPAAEADVRKAIAGLREEAQQLRTHGHDAPGDSHSASPTPNQPSPSTTNELQPEEDLKPAPQPRPQSDLTKEEIEDLAKSGELSEEEVLDLAEAAELSQDDVAELEEFFSEEEDEEELNEKDPEPDPEIEEPRLEEERPEDEVAGAVQNGPSQSMRTGEIVDTRPPGFTGGVSGSLIDGSGQSMNMTGGKRFKKANKEVEDLADTPGAEATERRALKNNEAEAQKEVNQAENLQNNNAAPQMTPSNSAKANMKAEEDEGILTKSASFAINALTLGWANMGQKRREDRDEEFDYKSPAPGF